MTEFPQDHYWEAIYYNSETETNKPITLRFFDEDKFFYKETKISTAELSAFKK
jgi:hypothetical protein